MQFHVADPGSGDRPNIKPLSSVTAYLTPRRNTCSYICTIVFSLSIPLLQIIVSYGLSVILLYEYEPNIYFPRDEIFELSRDLVLNFRFKLLEELKKKKKRKKEKERRKIWNIS